jgi:hypothetical protein
VNKNQNILEAGVKVFLQRVCRAVLIADKAYAEQGGFRLAPCFACHYCDTRGVRRDVTHEFDPP